MKNVHLEPFRRPSAFRRIAPVVWSAPREPNIFGTIFVRAGALLDWLEARNAAAGPDTPRITVTHAVARAVALTLARHPDANAIVFRRRLMRRRDIDVFVHVLVEGDGMGEADLSGVVIRQADRKDIEALAAEVRAGARRIRGGDDKDFESTKSMSRLLPPSILGWALRLIDFLQWTVNVDTGWLGAPRDPFGSALVTSVGMLGLRIGYAPFFPLARTPICVMVGAVEDAVVAEDGQPVVRKQLVLNATADHRVIDGFHAAQLARTITHLLEHPAELDTDSA